MYILSSLPFAEIPYVSVYDMQRICFCTRFAAMCTHSSDQKADITVIMPFVVVVALMWVLRYTCKLHSRDEYVYTHIARSTYSTVQQ